MDEQHVAYVQLLSSIRHSPVLSEILQMAGLVPTYKDFQATKALEDSMTLAKGDVSPFLRVLDSLDDRVAKTCTALRLQVEAYHNKYCVPSSHDPPSYSSVVDYTRFNTYDA